MHARQAFAWIAREYVRHPPHGDNELIARELIRRDVHFVRADFWIAYAVSFLTDESVIASPPRGQGERMARYLDTLHEHKPCRDSGDPVQVFYPCPPKGERHRSQ